MTFRREAEAAAIAWKATTPLLPDAARASGPVRGKGSYDFCLPAEYAGLNLLPEANQAHDWFAAAGIPWHDSVADGPTNHLLSSQVQCVNALAPMADDAAAIRWFFESGLDIAEVLPVGTPEAPDAFVAFEWIGVDNPLGEWRTGTGTRGSMNTSADAAIRYRNSVGGEELALVEWKYVENYRSSTYDDKHLDLRLGRYRPLLDEVGCPIRSDVDHADLICEPIYQLMRLQLLAWRTELLDDSLSAVRLVVCAPRENDGYHRALPRRLRDSAPSPAFEATRVGTMWRGLLTTPDRFVVVDTGRLVEPDSPTSVEFKARYAHLGNVEAPLGENEVASDSAHQRSAPAARGLLNTPTNNAPWAPSRHLLEVASWRVVAALVRRHPRLLLVETHPGGGQYDCLTLLDLDNPTSNESINLNRVGSAHLWRFNHRSESGDSENPDSWSTFWLEWLGADQIERVLLDLERRSGLDNPVVGPPSVAARCIDFIATTLAQTLFSGVHWECRNGMEDTSGYGGGPRDHYFTLFPKADSRRAVRVSGDLNGVPEYRFWFLTRDGRPVACVETTGTVWTVDGRQADLDALELQGGTIAAAVADLMAGWLSGG